MTPIPRPTDSRRAAASILAACLLFVACESLVKTLSPTIPTMTLVAARNLPSALVAAAILTSRGEPVLGRNRRVLALRGLFGFLGLALYFHSLGRLPLGDANVIIRASPVFTMVFSALFLGEGIRPSWLVSLAVMMAGAILVAGPSFTSPGAPGLVCLAASCAAGAAYTTLRALGATDGPWSVVLYFSTFCTLGSLPWLVAGGGPGIPPGNWSALAGLGAAGLGAQYFLTSAYRWAAAGQVALYSFVQIPMAMAAGLVVFRECPSPSTLAGGLLILAGAVHHGRSSRAD